ncbi:MAG TPA: HAD family phosphatase [Rubrivivax sp.]|nr:HAD family phosphatase [Rubrivivax sp.]
MKVVFDFGGVLFDWNPGALLQRELPHVARDDGSAAHWVAQIFQGYGGDWGEFDRGAVDAPTLVQRIATRTGLLPTDVQRVVDGVPHELQPKPDCVALLRRLHGAGYDLYFLSNMPEMFADHLERTHDFMRLFRDGVFSSRVKHIKPASAIFRIAEQRFGHPAQELIFLDDTRVNVEAACALGWLGLHFKGADQAARDLQAAGLVF